MYESSVFVSYSKERPPLGVANNMPNKQHESSSPPIVTIVGNSGSGKTTLIEKLIVELKRRGLKIGTIKHDVHGFEMDKPGKDSWRHKQAGAVTTIITSPRQIGMVKDVDHDHTPDELASFFTEVDLILCEGFKRLPFPKMEIFRPEIHSSRLCTDDKHLLAVISNVAERGHDTPPCFGLNAVQEIATFLIEHFSLTP